jgi:hypothetical protein
MSGDRDKRMRPEDPDRPDKRMRLEDPDRRHYFAVLKNYGHKTVKFKQGRYLSQLRKENNDETMEETLKKVRDGVCTAISLDWLATRVGLSTTQYLRDDDAHHKDITEAMASVQKKFMVDSKRETPSVSARISKMAAEQFGGLKLTKDKETVPVKGKCEEAIENAVKLMKAAKPGDLFLMIMQMTLRSGNPSHATGVERIEGGVCFFDPGIGEYSITDPQIEDFFLQYFRLKASHWENGLTLKDSNLILSFYSAKK